jgi:hypothetical protein
LLNSFGAKNGRRGGFRKDSKIGFPRFQKLDFHSKQFSNICKYYSFILLLNKKIGRRVSIKPYKKIK